MEEKEKGTLHEQENLREVPLEANKSEETQEVVAEVEPTEEVVEPIAEAQPAKKHAELTTEAEIDAELQEKIVQPVAEVASETAETEDEHDDLTDVAEVESDEHSEVDEYAAEHKELPEYGQMAVKELVLEADKLLKSREAHEVKDEIEAIYSTVIKALDEVRNEKLHQFVEEGGHEIDFFYDQPERRAIQQLYKEYKTKRREHYRKLEEQLSANLDVKKAIIEELKALPNEEGSVNSKYNRFRDLQDRWHNTGPVPRTESNELWNNYHHHIDNFYDFLRISNQLRDLDFKKNLEAKTALCEEAEALDGVEVGPDSFKALQDLHAKWKRIGPVDRLHSEPIWERFSEASKKVHDKRHEFYRELRVEREKLIERKQEIVAALLSINVDDFKTHGAWQTGIKTVNALRDEFKNIGRINLAANDVVWEEFRNANRAFNQAKNAFYKELKADHQKNLDLKHALLNRANELKESTDWRAAANELKRIQSDWKNIGYVPKVESDKIWKEFRHACNHFFKRLTDHHKEAEKELFANLETKKALFEKLKAWKPTDAKDKGVSEIKEIISQWKSAGRLPHENAGLDNDFSSLLDAHFKTLNLNKREATLIHFENKVSTMLDSDRLRQLDREEEELSKKIEEAKKELNQLENNILFFAHVDKKNPIVRDAQKNIDRQKEFVELLISKLKMMRKMQREAAAPPPEVQTQNTTESTEE
jgi:hypothetical protein